jgi:hypothetical protein
VHSPCWNHCSGQQLKVSDELGAILIINDSMVLMALAALPLSLHTMCMASPLSWSPLLAKLGIYSCFRNSRHSWENNEKHLK